MDNSSMTNDTKKEHFIPQVYLRGFSPEYDLPNAKAIPREKYRIYYYDLSTGFQSEPIPVKSQCYINDLYEVYGKDNQIILLNHIEKVLKELEIAFSHYRDELEKVAFNEENYNLKRFLRKKERIFWATYITVQLLRTPQVLEGVEIAFQDILGYQISNNEARNFAREMCTPFFKELTEDSFEAKLFDMVFTPMCGMSFVVLVDRQGRFITSDKAVYVHSNTGFPCKEYELLYFPITSKLCLSLYGGRQKDDLPGDNFLYPADDALVETVFSAIVDSAYEKVYSNHRFNRQESRWIHNILKVRNTNINSLQ